MLPYLFHQFDVVIGMKRIIWYQPKIPEHPSCKYVNAPEICMEPSEYMLVPNENYKRVATWSYITDLKHNKKPPHKLCLNLDVKYRTQPNFLLLPALLLPPLTYPWLLSYPYPWLLFYLSYLNALPLATLLPIPPDHTISLTTLQPLLS